MLKLFRLNNKIKGFSLIEALIAIAILAIITIILANLLTRSAFSTRDDFFNLCLLQGAASGIEEARGNPSLIGTSLNFDCGNLDVRVTLRNINTYGNCTFVEAEAQLQTTNKKAILRDLICAWTQ